jgi:16S rRNA G527 N7-methylase RsmG
VELLVAPVLPAAPLVGARLIDVGSGNGSPGLVLALLRPEVAVTLLEPRAKRWAFLREAVRACGRADVEVLRARHDGYDGAPAPTVTLRALALAPGALAPLTARGGRVIVFGRRPEPEAGWEAEPSPSPGITLWRRL